MKKLETLNVSKELSDFTNLGLQSITIDGSSSLEFPQSIISTLQTHLRLCKKLSRGGGHVIPSHLTPPRSLASFCFRSSRASESKGGNKKREFEDSGGAKD